MNRQHRINEYIILGVSIIGALLIALIVLQPNSIEEIAHIDFIIQFSVISTFVTAICIAGASYAGMFYAQERFGKDLIIACSMFNLGIMYFFYMIGHPGSYFSRWIELSVAKSDIFFGMGYFIMVSGLLFSSFLGTNTLSSSSEKIIGLVGFILLPVISAFLVIQELGVFVIQFDSNLVFAISFWGIFFLSVLIVISLLITGKLWKNRRNSTVLGTILFLIFLLIAALLKLFQIVIDSTFLPIELAGVYAALFGPLVFAISLLGTSMIDPHWRK